MLAKASKTVDSSQPLKGMRTVSFMWTTDNSTSLQYSGASMVHGTLREAPPALIPAGSQGLRGGLATTSGVYTGTEGRFTFILPGVATPTPCKMTLYFDKPFWGSNEYSCTLSADCGGKVSCSVGNGEGELADLLTTVRRSS
ncbi:hypothetical protein N2152v2_006876 [Parachlorella kessleri]